MTKTRVEDLDWNNLGFEYHDLPTAGRRNSRTASGKVAT